jgi:hypothetical protein
MLKFTSNYCKIYYHPEISTVHLDWTSKMAPNPGFMEACNFALNLLEEYKASKMIADNSKVTVVAVENQNWLTEKWFPLALEKGFRYSAVILADDAFVKYAVRKIENKINNEMFVVQYFNSTEDAMIWLASV